MNIYFDTEFTGLVPNTTLISIGMITEEGQKFYGEFTDYDRSLVNDWIKENVIDNLAAKYVDGHFEYSTLHKQLMNDDTCGFYIGNSNYILKKLMIWLEKESMGERIQFVSDVCHYDMYLLCNLFGGAFELPDYINPVCYDICQDISEYIRESGYNFINGRNMMYAFDVSREEFLTRRNIVLPKGIKHNALYDAEVIKLLYEYFYHKKHYMFSKARNIYPWSHAVFDSWCMRDDEEA